MWSLWRKKESVQKTGGKIRERIEGKERGEVGTQTMYDEKKAGRVKKKWERRMDEGD